MAIKSSAQAQIIRPKWQPDERAPADAEESLNQAAPKTEQPSVTLADVEQQIDRLLLVCARLQEENKKLRDENKRLHAKNEAALAKVVSIIGHLRTLEKNP